uniref:Putative secreted protein n=1 Tax=Anopheles marajoara TaxID=58244 RepID=A0A2M4CF37_9DIPT
MYFSLFSFPSTVAITLLAHCTRIHAFGTILVPVHPIGPMNKPSNKTTNQRALQNHLHLNRTHNFVVHR